MIIEYNPHRIQTTSQLPEQWSGLTQEPIKIEYSPHRIQLTSPFFEQMEQSSAAWNDTQKSRSITY